MRTDKTSFTSVSVRVSIFDTKYMDFKLVYRILGTYRMKPVTQEFCDLLEDNELLLKHFVIYFYQTDHKYVLSRNIFLSVHTVLHDIVKNMIIHQRYIIPSLTKNKNNQHFMFLLDFDFLVSFTTRCLNLFSAPIKNYNYLQC